MLIEHTSRSKEDKPEIYICVGALQQSTRCFNQQSLNMVSQPAMSHNPLGQRNDQLKSQPKKSTLSVNGHRKQQQQLGQRRKVKFSVLPRE